MKTIVFTARKLIPGNRNCTRWSLTLYRVIKNKPVHMDTIKTEYSDHRQNIREYLMREYHPKTSYIKIAREYDIIELY